MNGKSKYSKHPVLPEYKPILNSIRMIFIKSYGTPFHTPETLEINLEKKSKMGLEIEIEDRHPKTLLTPDGSYCIMGGCWTGSMNLFNHLLSKDYDVETIIPKDPRDEVSKHTIRIVKKPSTIFPERYYNEWMTIELLVTEKDIIRKKAEKEAEIEAKKDVKNWAIKQEKDKKKWAEFQRLLEESKRNPKKPSIRKGPKSRMDEDMWLREEGTLTYPVLPEYKPILDDLRRIFREAGGEPYDEPEDWPIDTKKKSKMGLEILIHDSAPLMLLTPHGKYEIIGRHRWCHIHIFELLLAEIYDVQTIVPSHYHMNEKHIIRIFKKE